MAKDDKLKSENNTLIISANTKDKNNLTTSVLYPLPISIIKPENSYADSPSPSNDQTVNYENYNTIKNSNSSLEINFINIIQNLSLAIAIILVGFIIYKKIKNRDELKKKY